MLMFELPGTEKAMQCVNLSLFSPLSIWGPRARFTVYERAKAREYDNNGSTLKSLHLNWRGLEMPICLFKPREEIGCADAFGG